ncbi:probable zinc transporter protein DDB_G0291141 isoform X1 [Salvia hispanica]|uniref:probable zinc transporter protein DDB_G0291141 isoform X1 n=1 Tax=Salvia hispanica TaxID=49212 RepID=UPI002008FCBD|nr:probable zinc transporter protein DDB_G0291141 isoform X1 [Salvia hispanica]XP_047962451.1 probable zinc transporter protein DDB_G0291141 isoform X1 [Salvia hispanica]
MADHHHHHHRPNRISLPPRAANAAAAATPTPRPAYPLFPHTPFTPAATPSKLRRPISRPSAATSLFLLLFSLRSLYSLFPFLRASPPSFSIFPFSFLVSLLSFFLTLSFSLFASVFGLDSHTRKSQRPLLSLTLITQSQHKLLAAKSLLLAVVFLLRFQALRYCGAAALILAELAGIVAARFFQEGKNRVFTDGNSIGSSKIRGFIALLSGLILLSLSWDRIECFPLSHVNIINKGFAAFPNSNCLRIWPMLLPFLSGFLGCYERVLSNWGEIRELGQKRVRLITLFFTTVVLFIPACVSMLVFEFEGDSISLSSLGWPLVNTVVFGVLLSENYTDEKSMGASKDNQREYFVTFVCTLVLELFYFPELSLWGLLVCGLLLWIATRELNPVSINYPELGYESNESRGFEVMKPLRHILGERKSRKIALFLLINTAYMVVEFVAGFMSNSLGLISDACHMLFDCAALAIGLYASYISRLPANGQFNYGRGRFEVLSGYANAVFLVLVGALITLESFERILDPQEISTSSLLSVSIGGLVVNMVGLVFFHEEHHHAHGGSGSCSHSHHSHGEEAHSHEHHHDHHSQHHGDKHQEVVGIVHDCSEKSCSKHEEHHHHHHPKNEQHDHGHEHVELHGHNHHHHHSHVQDQHHHFHHDHQNHVGQSDHSHSHAGEKEKHDLHLHSRTGQLDHHHKHVEPHHHHHDVNVDNQHHHHHQNHIGQSDHNHSHAGEKEKHDLHLHHQTDQLDHHQKHVDPHHHHDANVDSHHHHHIHHHDHAGEKEKKHHHHHHIDHNMQGIFLHVLADTLGSVGVVISTLMIKYKGWLIADPACSIFISALIVSSVIPLLRNSAEVLLQRVPRSYEQDLKEALSDVMKLKGVLGSQNFHVWSFTNTDVVGTIHLHVSADSDKLSIKKQVSHILRGAGVKDLAVQVECIAESLQPL